MTDENEYHDLMSDLEIGHDKMNEIIEEHATEGGLVVASDVLPTGLPIIPLRPRPAFPGIMIPLVLNGQSQVAALHQARESYIRYGVTMVHTMADPGDRDRNGQGHRLGRGQRGLRGPPDVHHDRHLRRSHDHEDPPHRGRQPRLPARSRG